MIVAAAILPHGEVIPALAGPDAHRTLATHLAMVEVGRRMQQARPETIVIATPHGVHIPDYVGIALTERGAGSLENHGAMVTVDLAIDRELTDAIADDADALGVPVARCVADSPYAPGSTLALDWGCVIPLWYCGAQWEIPPKIVVVVPTRSIDETLLVEFGRCVARAAKKTGRRTAFIASGDWAHAQAKDGPYGYHPDAAKYDNLVKEIIRSGDLTRFMGLDPQFIENAKPDGNWQTLMLSGAIEGSELKAEILSYECPTYFGMLVAWYR